MWFFLLFLWIFAFYIIHLQCPPLDENGWKVYLKNIEEMIALNASNAGFFLFECKILKLFNENFWQIANVKRKFSINSKKMVFHDSFWCNDEKKTTKESDNTQNQNYLCIHLISQIMLMIRHFCWSFYTVFVSCGGTDETCFSSSDIYEVYLQ